jgi:prepilin-type N-terminal cleavage/methylation domain-containing protein
MAKMFRLKKQVYRGFLSQLSYERRNLSAFTMVEIIVALSILSISALAVFRVLRMCSTADNSSQMLTKSVLLAESLLSETMLKEPVVYQTTQGTKGLFEWQIQVAPTEMDNLATICVQVKWLEQHKPQRYELLSLLYIPATFGGQ